MGKDNLCVSSKYYSIQNCKFKYYSIQNLIPILVQCIIKVNSFHYKVVKKAIAKCRGYNQSYSIPYKSNFSIQF